MADLNTIISAVKGRTGHAAGAVALTLMASAAFAQGDRDEGLRLTRSALTVQALVHDEPQDDTVLTAEERDALRSIARQMSAKRTPVRIKATREQMEQAAAVDLISTAGMISRRRADADASLRMVLAFNKEGPDAEAARASSLRDLGLPIRLGAGDAASTIRFEAI